MTNALDEILSVIQGDSEGCVVCGDCLDLLPLIPAACCEVVTDPPYGIDVDTSWLSALNVKRGKPANKSDAKVMGDDCPFDITPLLPFGRRVVFGHPYIYDTMASGWLVWDKHPGIDGTSIASPVEMASSTSWKGMRVVRCLWGGYYRDAGECRYDHPTQKPLRVMTEAILLSRGEGQVVLDPFCGSGTTCVAAKKLGRRYIGIDIEPKYVEIAKNRLRDTPRNLFVEAGK